jgi:hypothetical protein
MRARVHACVRNPNDPEIGCRCAVHQRGAVQGYEQQQQQQQRLAHLIATTRAVSVPDPCLQLDAPGIRKRNALVGVPAPWRR